MARGSNKGTHASPSTLMQLPHDEALIRAEKQLNSSKNEKDDDIFQVMSTTSFGSRHRAPSSGLWNATTAAAPAWTGLYLKVFLTVTVALYVLNQKHLLPKPLSALVSQALFWPTLPITVARRIGKWITKVDDTVIMGGAPFGFLNFPEKLQEEYNVRGVVNFCQEYRGPVGKYNKLGMKHLRLPTVDHFEPSTDDLMNAVAFIKEIEAQGQRVYVHCRAGHGRSAAAVMAWLLHKDPTADPQQLNVELCQMRNVRPTLWKQPNLRRFHEGLKQRSRDDVDQAQTQSDSSSEANTGYHSEQNDDIELQ